MTDEAVIDLRSDTVTKPSDAMRAAMAAAEVGDDVLDHDPTTARLEARIAELFDMPAALFFPSGIQANQTAVWLQTKRGTEILLEADSHLVHYEMAAVAALSGVQIRPVATADGVLTAELVEKALRPDTWYVPEVSAIAAENTHNAAGGKTMPLAVWDGLVALAQERKLPLHLDGARIWNAIVALEEAPARVVRGATTVSVSLSKALGCPVGSCLLGSLDTIRRARESRRRLGGAMRQTGILAAAGLFALEHNLERIADDHRNAALLAERLDGHPIVRPLKPETNIVMLALDSNADADAVVATLADAGVLLVAFGPTRLRAVTHLDVTTDDILHAAEIISTVVRPEGG